jgi:hypothetical protein
MLEEPIGAVLRVRRPASGQHIKWLEVFDAFTHECPASDVAGSMLLQRVIEVLSRLIGTHRALLFLRSATPSGRIAALNS